MLGIPGRAKKVCSHTSTRAHFEAILRQTYLATRSGTWLLTRVGPAGMPADYFAINRYGALAGQARPGARIAWLNSNLHVVRDPVDDATASVVEMLPMWAKNTIAEGELSRNLDLSLYNLQPKHRLLQAHPSINGELIGRINTGVRASFALRLDAVRWAF